VTLETICVPFRHDVLFFKKIERSWPLASDLPQQATATHRGYGVRLANGPRVLELQLRQRRYRGGAAHPAVSRVPNAMRRSFVTSLCLPRWVAIPVCARRTSVRSTVQCGLDSRTPAFNSSLLQCPLARPHHIPLMSSATMERSTVTPLTNLPQTVYFKHVHLKLPRHTGRCGKTTLPRHGAWRGNTTLPRLSFKATSMVARTPRPKSSGVAASNCRAIAHGATEATW
jgi:hypothetical protein